MNKAFINLDQIAGAIAEKLNLEKTKTVLVVREINEAIADDLKDKGKVRLHEFGLFYLGVRKSRSIYQIRTKEKRLLLEQTLIKFKAEPRFKRKLNGSMPRKKSENLFDGDSVNVKIDAKSEKEFTGVPISVKNDLAPSARIKLPPYSLMHPVDPESVRLKILERIKKIKPVEQIKRKLEMSLPTKLDLTQSQQGKIFQELFRQVQKHGLKNIDFTIGTEKVVSLYTGRPRVRLAGIPVQVVREFLDNCLELREFDIPQERFTKIELNGARFIKAYSLPTQEGASVYLEIEGK